MTEITRVPLQPIAKGSLAKLWIGVVVAILVGAGLAWAAMPKSTTVDTVTAGTGAHPGPSDVVFIKYVGKLADGKVFDQSRDIGIPTGGLIPDGTPLQVSGSVPGFAKALQKMQKGGKYVVHIPAKEGYGAKVPEGGPIPPNADLVFDVTLVDFMSEGEARQRFQLLQQMMQMQQQKGARAGAHGEAAPPPPPVE